MAARERGRVAARERGAAATRERGAVATRDRRAVPAPCSEGVPALEQATGRLLAAYQVEIDEAVSGRVARAPSPLPPGME